MTVTPLMNIYGMAQCTRDVTGDDCNRCLVGAVNYIPMCCGWKQKLAAHHFKLRTCNSK
jgi:hypothetical protein